MSHVRTSLENHVVSERNDEDRERDKIRLWNLGVLVVSIDDQRLNWVNKQWLENIGNDLYGRRNNGKT